MSSGESGGGAPPEGPAPDGRILWLAFEVTGDGRVRTVVTLDRDGDRARERRESPSLEAAGRIYGPGFVEVVRACLESGSRRGRWRP